MATLISASNGDNSSSDGEDGIGDAADRRRRLRRQVTVDEALGHALQIMTERGVAALTIAEMARRMGVRSPSLYRYFASLHEVYDRLFALGQEANASAVARAVDGVVGVDRLRAGTRATVRWCVANPALAQLLYWRVVPGFEPAPTTMAPGAEAMTGVRSELADAVHRGELAPSADSEAAVRLLTVLISGLVTQQLANEPGAGFDSGAFSSLTDEAVDAFLGHYRPRSQ